MQRPGTAVARVLLVFLAVSYMMISTTGSRLV
jgi:hypothetical protein